MLIGVLSDTHLSKPDPILDYILDHLFAETDMILHAGDIVSRRVLDRMEERGVLAVCGNMDDYAISDSVPQKRILHVSGRKVGMMHGWGGKIGLHERIISQFTEDKPDLIIHGHSHIPFWGEINGIMVFNPGSAAQSRYAGGPTVGLLNFGNLGIDANFIQLEESAVY